MATTCQPNDLISIRAWTRLGDQGAVNTYNFDCISITGTSITDVALAAYFDPLMAGFYGGGCANDVEYRGIQLYFIKRTGPLPAPIINTTSSGNCTGGTNSLPRVVCPIMKYATFVRGPGGRGRLYLPFFPTTVMTSDGELSNGGRTYIDTWGSFLVTPFTVGSGGNTASFVFALVQRKPIALKGQILTAFASGKFGQMHKRGDYGRPNNSPI